MELRSWGLSLHAVLELGRPSRPRPPPRACAGGAVPRRRRVHRQGRLRLQLPRSPAVAARSPTSIEAELGTGRPASWPMAGLRKKRRRKEQRHRKEEEVGGRKRKGQKKKIKILKRKKFEFKKNEKK